MRRHSRKTFCSLAAKSSASESWTSKGLRVVVPLPGGALAPLLPASKKSASLSSRFALLKRGD